MSNWRVHLECFLIEMISVLLMLSFGLFLACMLYWAVFTDHILNANQEIIERQMTWASAFPGDTFFDWWVWELWGKPASIMTGCIILGLTGVYLITRWLKHHEAE